MDLLKQCQKWIEEGKEQRVIEEIEAMPADERTPELDSELARAYRGPQMELQDGICLLFFGARGSCS